MKFVQTPLRDVIEIHPNVFKDERGHFFENFKKKIFEDYGINANFVQDNQSLSKRGVLRGLHFQKPPFAQAKLVYVVKGKVLDVAVDIRKNSPDFGKYYSTIIDDKNKKILFIPEGFAHGFLTLKNNTIFCYKCSNYYNKESDSGILWNDPALNINWQLSKYSIEQPFLSEKDSGLMTFKEYSGNPVF